MGDPTVVQLAWGPRGLRLLSETCECVVIVDEPSVRADATLVPAHLRRVVVD